MSNIEKTKETKHEETKIVVGSNGDIVIKIPDIAVVSLKELKSVKVVYATRSGGDMIVFNDKVKIYYKSPEKDPIVKNCINVVFDFIVNQKPDNSQKDTSPESENSKPATNDDSDDEDSLKSFLFKAMVMQRLSQCCASDNEEKETKN